MLRTGIKLIVAFTLAGCGMKGDLYLPPEEPAADVAAPLAEDAPPADEGERRTIPPTPDPSLSR
jgi:predicted small lipoprotein YifL